MTYQYVNSTDSAGVLLFAVSVVGFALLRLMPGNFVTVLLTTQMDGHLPSAEAVARFAAERGFDDPLPVQYLRWLGAVMTGDWGASVITGEDVASEIALRVLNSLMLTASSIGLAVSMAFPIGIFTALYPNSILDRLVAGVSVIALSIPNFWYTLLLTLLLSLMLGWLPSSGFRSPQHIILPTLVISTSIAGVMARYIRNVLLEESAKPYMLTAKAKGRTRLGAIVFHAIPNASPALLTLVGLQTTRIFEGMLVVETIFAWPGMGRMLVDALMSRDFPVIQACFIVIATAHILVNLTVDLTISALDRRTKGAV